MERAVAGHIPVVVLVAVDLVAVAEMTALVAAAVVLVAVARQEIGDVI